MNHGHRLSLAVKRKATERKAFKDTRKRARHVSLA